MINTGFVIAKKNADGSMGRPIGNEDGAIMLFDDVAVAKPVKQALEKQHGVLSIFTTNLVFVGEVL